MSSTYLRHLAPIAALAVALFSTGCATVAEDVSKHLLANDLKTLQYDHCVFEHDLALFRGCLQHRGGACEGSATTAVPGSAQHASGQPVSPARPGSSTTLSQAIAELPPNHPARTAYHVLTHPVTHQAADLHHHLRGHDGGSSSSTESGSSDSTESGTASDPGGSTSSTTASGTDPTRSGTASSSSGGGSSGTGSSAGQGPVCGSQPTHTTHLKLHHVTGFHESLLASIGHTGWEALANQCDKLLAKHPNAPDLHSLRADCRSAAFIRKYIGAYLRQGEFIRVDLSLSDEVADLNRHATTLTNSLQSIQNQIAPIQALLPAGSTTALSTADAATVAYDTASLVASIDAQTRQGYQILVAEDFLQLEQDNRQAAALADSLLKTNTAADAAQLGTVLSSLDTDLGNLQTSITSEDGKLDTAIDNQVTSINSKLSNVVKIRSTGFVSRDLTFGARLPTLQLTVDPDFGHFKTTLTDVDAQASAADSGKRLTGKSSFSNLGIVTQESSGVGTGASIGAELVRVFFEAMFDAHEGLPALSQSGTRATGLTLRDEYKLPIYHDPTANVSTADLQRITHVNTAVALETRLIIGRVIAGIGPFNLDNQPLEDLITEIITTSVRKATEKATWCWYACNLDADVEQLRQDAGTAAGDAIKKAAKDAERKVEHWVHDEVEHVKVRFKVSQ